jgi:hypothetical protein
MDMAKCPVCTHEVKTPFFLKADAWRWLKCPHCGARLERKNPRLLLPLTSLYLCLLALGRLGHRWAVVAEALLVVTVGAMIALLIRPQLQVRKPLPEPETTLKIDSEAQRKR